jgi:hypothetical protein
VSFVVEALIVVSHPVSCHPTISHGFLKAVRIDALQALPRAAAMRIDALPAAVTLSAGARRQAACIHVPAAVAESA